MVFLDDFRVATVGCHSTPVHLKFRQYPRAAVAAISHIRDAVSEDVSSDGEHLHEE